jgi:hypothetical protein
VAAVHRFFEALAAHTDRMPAPSAVTLSEEFLENDA